MFVEYMHIYLYLTRMLDLEHIEKKPETPKQLEFKRKIIFIF